MAGNEPKKVDSWDEEVTDKPAMKVSSWDEEVVDAPKKKEPTTVSQEATTSGSQQPAKPSGENGGKVEQVGWTNVSTPQVGLTPPVKQTTYDPTEAETLRRKETDRLKSLAIKKSDEVVADYSKAKQEVNAVDYATQYPEYQQLLEIDKQIDALGQPKTAQQIVDYNALVAQRNQLLDTPVSGRDVFAESAPTIVVKQPSEFDTPSEYAAYQSQIGQQFKDFTEKKKKFDSAKPTYEGAITLRDIIAVAETKRQSAANLDAKIKADQKEADEAIAAAQALNKDKLEPLGFGSGFMEGMEQTTLANSVADIHFTGNDEQLLKYLENIYEDAVVFPKQATTGGQVGELLGGQVKPLAVGLTGGAVNPTLGFGAATLYYGRLGAGRGLIDAYTTARSQGKTEPEALEIAKSQAVSGGIGGLLEGAAGALTFGGKPLASLATMPFKKAVTEALKDNSIDAVVAGINQVVQNKNMQRLGLDVETGSGVAENMAAELIFGAGMNMAMYGGSKIKGYGTIINGLAKLPFQDIQTQVDAAVKAGTLDAAKGQVFLQDVVQSKAAQDKLKGVEIPEEAEDGVIDLQKEIDVLEDEKKNASPAVLPAIEAQVEVKSMEIAEELGTPLSLKEQKEYEKLIAKRDTTDGEGKKTPLLESEKKMVAHYEARIDKAENIAKAKEKEFKEGEQYEAGDVVELTPEVTEPKTEENATKEISGQERIQEKPENGSEGGETVSPSDGLQRGLPSAEGEEIVTQTPEQEAQETPAEEAAETPEQQRMEQEQGSEMQNEELVQTLETPLKDAYNARKEKLDEKNKRTDMENLSVGDYVAVRGNAGNLYKGFVKSIGRKNIIIEAPYGGYGDSDFLQIQELKFPKDKAEAFYTQKNETPTDTKSVTNEADIKDDYEAITEPITMPDGEAGVRVTIQKPNGETVVVGDMYPEDVEAEVAKKVRGFKLQDSKATSEPTAEPPVDSETSAQPESNIGKEVVFDFAGGQRSGEVIDIDENGSYKVKSRDGTNYTVKPENAKTPLSEKSGTDIIKEGWQDILDALNNPTGALALNPKLVTGLGKIGYGLIKQGYATTANVIEKIREYIRDNGGFTAFTEKDFNESAKDIRAKVDEFNQKSFLETMKDSPQTTEEMKAKVEELDQYYETQHNNDAIRAADKRIKEDIGAAKEFVLSDAPPSAEKSVMAVRLIKHYEAAKDFDQAITIADSYDKQLREAGRFIQAASLWNKLSPETIVRSAKKEAEKLGKQISPEVEREIRKRMVEVEKMPEGTERDKATLEVLNYIADQMPYSFWDLFDAYRYQNMLSNPRSHERNIYGNLFNVFVTEPLSLAMRSGYDMTVNMNNPAARDAKLGQIPKYYKDALSNIPEAFMAAREAFRNGYVADKILDMGNVNSQIEALRRAKLPKYLTVATRLLEAQDRFFSVLIGQGEKMRLMREGVSETEATDRAHKLAEEYLYREKLDAKSKTNPLFVRALDSLGQGFNHLRKQPVIGKPLGWFMPFVSTPINVAKMGVKFSPLGFVGGDYNKGQIANATLGTIAMGVGANLAMQGFTTWAAPKDKKERELFYAAGMKPYSVKIGDKWVPMTYFGPFALSLAMPAAAKYYHSDNKTALTDNEAEKMQDAILATSGFITSQTPLSGADGFFKAIGGDEDYTVDKVFGYVGSQVIPLQGMVRYVNTMLDPVYRKSKTVMESIESGLPELSKELEPIRTPTGEEAKREDFNALLPYDLGISNEEYELLLKNRRELQQQREVAKEEGAPLVKFKVGKNKSKRKLGEKF